MHPLDGCWAKIDRAREHLEALDEQIAAFFEATPKPYEVGSDFRPDSSEYVFWIEPARQPPHMFGVLVGEYAHGLRSALDHLVCQLAMLNGPTDCATTQYPISRTRANFASVKPNWLRGVAPKHQAMIETTQPYHAGARADAHFLSILSWLDNVDKHRALHPTFGFLEDPGPKPQLTFTPNRDAGRILERRIANGRRIKGKTEIVRLKLAPRGPNPVVEMQGQLTMQPALGERWMRGTALQDLETHTRTIVQAFAADFPT